MQGTALGCAVLLTSGVRGARGVGHQLRKAAGELGMVSVPSGAWNPVVTGNHDLTGEDVT